MHSGSLELARALVYIEQAKKVCDGLDPHHRGLLPHHLQQVEEGLENYIDKLPEAERLEVLRLHAQLDSADSS